MASAGKVRFPRGVAALALGAAVAAGAMLAVAASAMLDGECDAAGGDPRCGEGGAAADVGEHALVEEANTSAVNGTGGPREVREISLVAIGFVLVLFVFVLLWIFATVKFACDGSLPARLALWGLLPEAYAAISVPSVIALIRLKSGPTPVIVLRGCVTDEGAEQLADALRRYGKKTRLEALEIPCNPRLSAKGVQALVTVATETGSELQELDLSYNPHLGSDVVAALRPLLNPKVSKVTTLRLADCGLQVADIQQLAEAAEKSRVLTLDLSCNELEGGGEALACVLEAPLIEELTLVRCGLSAEDVRHVAEQLPYTSLKSLQLGGNPLGVAGLEAIAEHLPKTQIDQLDLEAIGVEAEDLGVLASAWVKRPFARIRLQGNRMTNEEIASFVKTLRTMQA